MKLFATIFAAVLAAGLCLFGIVSCHNRSVAKWNELAGVEVRLIRSYLGEPGYNAQLDKIEPDVVSVLDRSPIGADTRELTSALSDLRARKAER